ncbi:MAG: minor capsid protein [Clostridiales bacterium]|jgi:hypothetical protein|nr:minor capsid protein [Clostridiales bacterium]
MNLTAVKAIVSEFSGIDIQLHSISRNREETLGIYPRRGNRAKREIIGADSNRAYEICSVTLLLRLGRDGVQAEDKAAQLYKALSRATFEFDGRKGFVMAAYDAPVWLGMDSRGVFEYAVDLDFYCELN